MWNTDIINLIYTQHGTHSITRANIIKHTFIIERHIPDRITPINQNIRLNRITTSTTFENLNKYYNKNLIDAHISTPTHYSHTCHTTYVPKKETNPTLQKKPSKSKLKPKNNAIIPHTFHFLKNIYEHVRL